MSNPILLPIIVVFAALLGGIAAFILVRRSAGAMLQEAQKSADLLKQTAQKEAETLKKAAIVDGRESLRQERQQFEQEEREHKKKLQERETQLDARLQKLETREQEIDRTRSRIDQKEQEVERRLKTIEDTKIDIQKTQERILVREQDLAKDLSQIAQLSPEQAKELLLKRVEEHSRHDAAKLAKSIEDAAKENAQHQAQRIISMAVQRYAGEYASDKMVTTVQIPDDKMKGRIIGREGRNIRTFEMITGVDLIVDESPDHVIISSHNPLRRQIARVTLERLMEDGRIQPTRIEELFQMATNDLEKEIRDAGQQAVFELGLQGLHAELVRLMGINKFRTSFGQNILHHSVEVGYLCGMMADELGLDRQLARRAGFLHDIGKAVDHELEGGHAVIGGDLTKKYGEQVAIYRAVAEHHEDNPSNVWGVLVQAADTLSAARPGARRETLDNYIKRLNELEEIASRHPEVQQSYAIQSGRELRLIIDAERSSDDVAFFLAKSIAAEIESEMKYPGQIKVTVVRETRATAFAK